MAKKKTMRKLAAPKMRRRGAWRCKRFRQKLLRRGLRWPRFYTELREALTDEWAEQGYRFPTSQSLRDRMYNTNAGPSIAKGQDLADLVLEWTCARVKARPSELWPWETKAERDAREAE